MFIIIFFCYNICTSEPLVILLSTFLCHLCIIFFYSILFYFECKSPFMKIVYAILVNKINVIPSYFDIIGTYFGYILF